MRGDPKCPPAPIRSGRALLLSGRNDRQIVVIQERKLPREKGRERVRVNLSNVISVKATTHDSPKEPCPNWSRGNGFWKYGPNCRLSHDGPKGGEKKKKSEVVFLTTKRGKKARNKLAHTTLKEDQQAASFPGTIQILHYGQQIRCLQEPPRT
jgi:hypothetical protein